MTTENSIERSGRPEKARQRVEELHPHGPEQKRAYRVNEFCAAYGLSRTTTYALIGAGKLRSVVVGGRRLIHKDDAEALFSEAAT
jgi:excisionase family DNA binding protein